MIKLRERRTTCSTDRVRFVLGICLLMFAMLLGGVVLRIEVQRDMLVSEAFQRYIGSVQLHGERGKISDRNGRPLAASALSYSAHINPQLFRRWASRNNATVVHSTISDIAKVLEIDKEKLKSILDRDSGFAYLAHRIDPGKLVQLQQHKLPLLTFEKKFDRYYLGAQEFAHLIGFTDHKLVGREGGEALWNTALAPKNGSRKFIRAGDGRQVEILQESPATNGSDITLTVDSRLQYLAMAALTDIVERHDADAAGLVMIDTHTGDILALANVPTYNPNNRDNDAAARRNRAVQDIFEPGSTMKPIIAAIAMNHGLIKSDTILKTAKPIKFGRYTIKDKKIHKNITVQEVIMRSSNVGAVRISQLLKDHQMYEGYQNFGFGDQIVLGMPGETPGKLHDYRQWREVEKATMAYGYGISANLLQVAQAYSVFANAGVLRQLRLVTDAPQVELRRVISADTAKQMIEIMESVTSNKGTARRARIHGYRVAGKTGTSHKRKKESKGYNHENYQSVFVGLAPASRPRFVIAVMVDSPKKNGYYGGTVAAPIFARVMEHALRLYAVAPDAPIAQVDQVSK